METGIKRKGKCKFLRADGIQKECVIEEGVQQMAN